MRKRNKWLALLLSVSMVMSTNVLPAAAANTGGGSEATEASITGEEQAGKFLAGISLKEDEKSVLFPFDEKLEADWKIDAEHPDLTILPELSEEGKDVQIVLTFKDAQDVEQSVELKTESLEEGDNLVSGIFAVPEGAEPVTEKDLTITVTKGEEEEKYLVHAAVASDEELNAAREELEKQLEEAKADQAAEKEEPVDVQGTLD